MRILLTACLAAAILASAAPAAQAFHRDNEYCSESGDVCLSARKSDGARTLRIGLAAKYFNRYELCVTAPGGPEECHTFRIEDTGASYGDSVRWRSEFTSHGKGKYTVKWKMMNGDRIGKRLGFHV